MKIALVTILLIIAGPNQAKSQAIAGDAGQVNAPSSRALQAVIEQDPKVKQFVNECYDDPNNPNIADCLWTKLRASGDQARILELIKQAQEAETAQMRDTTGPDSLPLQSSFSGADFDSFKRGDDKDGIRRKALDKLEEIYTKKLEEELKATNTKLKTTDQQVFYELAKTQLGKNVISAWSSVCMDAGWVNQKIVIFDKANQNILDNVRAKNIEALKEQTGKVSTERYFTCVASLPMLCHKSKGKIKKVDTSEAGQIQAAGSESNSVIDYRDSAYGVSNLKDTEVLSFMAGTNISTPNDDDKIEEMISNSRKRACETVAYVDGVRRQLAATEKLATIMQNDDVTKATYRAALVKNLRDTTTVSERAREDVDIDKVTTITSGELTDGADGYYGTIGTNITLINECKQDPSDPRCAQIVAETQEEKDKLRMSGVAFMLESKAIEEDLANLQSLSDDEKRLLLRRLRPGIDVNEVDVNQALSNISAIFKNERESLIESLSKQVDELEVAKPEDLQQRVAKVGDALLRRGNEYVQLMHFNNIISGYFDVEGGRSNVRVLDLELANVANLSTGQGLEDTKYGRNDNLFNSDDYAQNLQQRINEKNAGQLQVGTSADSEANTQVNLSSGQISQFLDYEIEDASNPSQQPTPTPDDSTTP